MVKIFKSKKGAELAMNVVVIAALAMLVLVVVGVIFLRGADIDPSKTCTAQQGICKNANTCDSNLEIQITGKGLCADNDKDGDDDFICCKSKKLAGE